MTVTTQATLLSDLTSLVGGEQVRADETICASLAVDGMVPRIAVFPSTPGQVAAVLQYTSEQRLALVPRGNGTKVAQGAPPRQYDIALSLERMRRVIHYEPADLTIGVEAGMALHEFEELVGRNNLWLPLDPRGADRSTLGGIIAANAAGPLRQGLGGPRDMVIGLKVATADGKITKTGGRVVKNVAGYDLGKLFTGSMGTLGVIVEANLKLFPKPPTRATFAFRVESLEKARELRRTILRSPLDPMRLVLLDSRALELLTENTAASGKQSAQLWIELGGSHRVIERCLLDLRHLASAAGATLERREDAEEAWQNISNLALWLQPHYRDVSVLKAALPLAVMEEFLRRTKLTSESAKIQIATFAQVGVGIAHICALEEKLSAGIAEFVGTVRNAAKDLGGTLVVEHCSLELKQRVDVWGAGSDDLGAMHKLKLVWDPNAVLSPGRFVDGV